MSCTCGGSEVAWPRVSYCRPCFFVEATCTSRSEGMKESVILMRTKSDAPPRSEVRGHLLSPWAQRDGMLRCRESYSLSSLSSSILILSLQHHHPRPLPQHQPAPGGCRSSAAPDTATLRAPSHWKWQHQGLSQELGTERAQKQTPSLCCWCFGEDVRSTVITGDGRLDIRDPWSERRDGGGHKRSEPRESKKERRKGEKVRR